MQHGLEPELNTSHVGQMAGLGGSSTDLQEGERGFGFRVRDSLGALGGYLTWAEYRKGHV